MNSISSLITQKKLKFVDFVPVNNSFTFSHSFQVTISPKISNPLNSIEQLSQVSLAVEIIFKQVTYLKKKFNAFITVSPKIILTKFNSRHFISLLVFMRAKFSSFRSLSKAAPYYFFRCNDVELFQTSSSTLNFSPLSLWFTFLPVRKKKIFFSFFLSHVLF